MTNFFQNSGMIFYAICRSLRMCVLCEHINKMSNDILCCQPLIEANTNCQAQKAVMIVFIIILSFFTLSKD